MDLDKYKETKFENLDFNINKYLELNEDLKHGKINNLYKVFNHWFKHASNENRIYNEQNIELYAMWKQINAYLKNNNYTSSSSAFIITTCTRNLEHLLYLKECIKNIRIIYPIIHIYVISDSCEIPIDEINGENIEIIDAEIKGGGEINPYLFALDDRCKHEKLIYIHDTVFIKKNIDRYINSPSEIIFIWYATKALTNDTITPENTEILNNFYFYFSNTKISLYHFINAIRLIKMPYTVKFGSMSIFTKEFMKKVDLVTNFKQVANLFNKRVHRCFFERILSFIYIFIYGFDYNPKYTVCGDIFTHPNAFCNKNYNIPTKTPMVKVWQGR
jgi:hypothetical protein